MTCGSACDFSRNSAESLLNQLPERPAGAIAGQHGKVVQMNIGIAVRVGDFIIVNFGEPVVCRNRSGVGKDQSADGIGDCGVFLDAPVADFQVVVHRCLVIKRGGRDGAEFFTLAAVQNISLGNVGVTRLYKHRFHAVLNIFDGDQPLFDLGLEIRRDFQCEEINDGGVILFFLCLESHSDCVGNLLQIEIDVFPVTFLYLVHCHPFQKV